MSPKAPDHKYYVLFFPTYTIGALLNAWVLWTMIVGRTHLLINRLAYCLCAAVSVCFFWSIASIIRSCIVNLTDFDSEVGAQIIAIVTTLAMFSITSANLFLALERYFIIREIDDVTTTKIFKYALTILPALAIIPVTMLCLSPASNTIAPDLSPYSEIWLVTITVTFGILSGIILYLYASTYYFIKTSLENAQIDEIVRLTLQRRVMTYCTIMSATLLACYVPVVVFVMVPNNIQENVWLTVISGQMVALDNVITPLLVVYFMPRLRESLMSFGNREV